MDLLDTIRSHVLALPDLAKFAVIIAVIVGVPRLAARIGVPPMVGLLLFGVALGPHVLGFFGEHRPIADFFAELGKLLLMFSAGLEIDIALFRRAQTRAITFGLVTTTVPLLFGTLLGLGFGYALIPAIVVGSLLASHTLLGVPIVRRASARCHATGADHRRNRRHRALGHALADRVRDLRLDLHDRVLAGGARHPAHRDRHFCAAYPRWAQSRRGLRIEQDGE
jgi:hypothetical protein